MVLLTHIIIALASIAFTAVLFAAPSKRTFFINYLLMGLTIASGTVLVVMDHAAMLKACESGLSYLVIVAALTAVARRRYSLKQTAEEL